MPPHPDKSKILNQERHTAHRVRLPGVPPCSTKGGDNVERITKLLQALAKLIAAIADFIRSLKA